ncbi:MAG TPA: DsrE family protein [candidate division Zixibacteria bacterium]|nr:DsrE family protein [candidate division Zixibacteria bacterium]
MSDKKKLVVVIACGLEDERSSVAWSVSNGGISTGLEVTVFLTSSAIDHVRKGAADKVHLNPLDPTLKQMIDNFTSRGGKILACPPCTHVRGYGQEDLLDGVVITGSGAIHELIKDGAATLCF